MVLAVTPSPAHGSGMARKFQIEPIPLKAQIPEMRGRNHDKFGLTLMACFKGFLEKFVQHHEDSSGRVTVRRTYLERLQEVLKSESDCLMVDWQDILLDHEDMGKAIQENYYASYPFLCQAIANIIRESFKVENIEDIIRKRNLMVAFYNVEGSVELRMLRSIHVGRLVKIRGQVVRSTPVQPELLFGTFECEECGSMVENVEQEFKYTAPKRCSNEKCNNLNRWKLNLKKSRFVDFQKVRIQETQEELPRGAVPRTLDVIVRGSAVEQTKPGDECAFTGVFLALPDVRAMHSRLPNSVAISQPGEKAKKYAISKRSTSGCCCNRIKSSWCSRNGLSHSFSFAFL